MQYRCGDFVQVLMEAKSLDVAFYDLCVPETVIERYWFCGTERILAKFSWTSHRLTENSLA